MNKWLKLALNSFIGIILLNLLYGILFGGSIGAFSLAGLFVFATKILYFLVVIGLIAGILTAARDFIFIKD